MSDRIPSSKNLVERVRQVLLGAPLLDSPIIEQAGGAAKAIPAAVLFPIVLRDPPTVLLTQRTSHLKDHPGQVSFPGGRVEASDASPLQAALREAEEEIGLLRQHVDVLGYLADVLVRVATHPASKIDELLPANWAKHFAATASA